MNASLTAKALCKVLLPQLQSQPSLCGLDVHASPADREAINATIGKDCVLQIRAQVFGPASRRTYSATLGIAYPSIEPDYDELWAIASRDSGDRYFPLACGLSELSDCPATGFPGSEPDAVSILAKAIAKAIHEHVWPLRTLESVRAEFERGTSSRWYSLAALENWLPVVLLREVGAQRACILAQEVLAKHGEAKSSRATAYRRFVANLEHRLEN